MKRILIYAWLCVTNALLSNAQPVTAQKNDPVRTVDGYKGIGLRLGSDPNMGINTRVGSGLTRPNTFRFRYTRRR